MTLDAGTPILKGNTILFERKFVPIQQDVSSNNVCILNDGKIILLIDDDENSTVTNNYDHGFLANMPGLDIEKRLPENNSTSYPLSQFYQRKQFSIQCPKEIDLGANKFVRISDQLNRFQPLINSQYQTTVRRVIKNTKYPILLLLTSNFNVLSFDYKNGNITDQSNKQHFKYLQNLDHKSDHREMEDLRFNVYYDAVFDGSCDFVSICNRNGYILLYKFNASTSQFEFVVSCEVIHNTDTSDDYIVSVRDVKVYGGENKVGVLGRSTKNNLYHVEFDLSDLSTSVKEVPISNKLFMVSDFVSVNDKIFYISANKLFDESNKEICEFSNYDLKQIKYIQSLQQLLIYSNNEMYILDLHTLQLVETPILKFLMKKHNSSKLDNFNLSLNIHGIDVTNNESLLLVLYSFTTNGGVRYITNVDRDISLSILKLKPTWELTGSDYNDSAKLWYFQYKFFGEKHPENYELLLQEQNDSTANVADYDQPFEDFIEEAILKNKFMKFNKYQALIEDSSVLDSILYAKILTYFYNYAKHNSTKITSTVDVFSVNMIAKKLNLEPIVDFSATESDFTNVLFKGSFIEDTFDIEKCFENDRLVSNNQYQWKYCFLTLLPLLGNNTKHCPITNIDIIDIDKDFVYNDYGWFTRSILTLLGTKSIVSDMDYV